MIQIFKRPRVGRRRPGGCVWPKCFWNLTWSWFVLKKTVKKSWCHFIFNAFHCFFKFPASKHRVRDEILHGFVVHMVPFQTLVSKSVFLNKNQSQKSVFLIKNRSQKLVFLNKKSFFRIKNGSQKSVFLIKDRSQKLVFLIKNRSSKICLPYQKSVSNWSKIETKNRRLKSLL